MSLFSGNGGILGWVVLVATAIGALGMIWRKAIRPVVHAATETADAVKGLRTLLEPDADGRTIPEQLVALKEQLADVDQRSKQLEPNGGNSLYDRVGKLEQGQTAARRRQAADMKKLEPMVETIAALSGPPRRTAPKKS